MKKIGTIAFLALFLASMAHAEFRGHREWHHGGRGGGLLGITMTLFAITLSEDTAHHKELVYIGAADEAAAFLQNGGEPSALLREALDTERNFLVEARIEGAQAFADETLAELVVGRAALLTQ